jgi:hypothetical protein
MTAARSNGRRRAARIVVGAVAACAGLAVVSPAAALGDAPILTPSLQPQPPAVTVAVPPPPVPTSSVTPAPPPPAVTAPALPAAPATTPAPQAPTPSVQAPTAPVPPAPAVAAPSLPAAPKAVPQAPTPSVQAPKVSVPSALAVPVPSLPAAPIAVAQPTQPTLEPAPALEVTVLPAKAVSASVESVARALVSSTAAGVDDAREAIAGGTSGTPAPAIGPDDLAVAPPGGNRATKSVSTTPQESRNEAATDPSAGQQPAFAPLPAAATAPGPALERQPPTAPQQLVAQSPVAVAVSSSDAGRLAGAAAVPTLTGDPSMILRSPAPLPSLPQAAGSEPLRQALPGRPAARAPQPVPPRQDGVAATSSTASGGGAAALLLLVCLTSFLWTAPPLRRWLRRQHGLALTSALLAPLENPG